MTLLQLKYFQSVCRYDSVSKAAESLNISQPAISIAIKELEEEFGVSLFIRDKKRLVLTTEGTFFLNKVSEILPQIDSLSRLMADLGNKERVLNLSVIPMSGSNLIIDSLHRLRSQFPDIQVSITECSSTKAVENVRDNLSNAAVIIADKKKYEALEGLILRRTKHVFCVGKSHPMANLIKCNLAQLGDQSLILFQDEMFVTKELKQRFYQLGIAPKVLLYTMNFTLIKRLISAGKEGVFLTQETASMLPDDTVQIPLEQPIEIVYALVWKRKPALSSSLARLVELIREDFPDAEFYE
jgi:DNA-binding transcriptional LysR family regulator